MQNEITPIPELFISIDLSLGAWPTCRSWNGFVNARGVIEIDYTQDQRVTSNLRPMFRYRGDNTSWTGRKIPDTVLIRIEKQINSGERMYGSLENCERGEKQRWDWTAVLVLGKKTETTVT